MKKEEDGGHGDQAHSLNLTGSTVNFTGSTVGGYETWQIDYLKIIYQNLVDQIQNYLKYIERATFWGAGVLLGAAGYLTTNIKQIPFSGKLILMSAVVVFGGSLVFSILRAIKDLKTCAREVAKIDTFFGAFEVGRYIPKTTLFPSDWQNWGQESWSERHLWVPPLIIYALAVLIVMLAIVRIP